jgi:hypothetical protein
MKLLAAILACLVLAACANAGYRPAPGANTEPVHGESGGGGGGGGSM